MALVLAVALAPAAALAHPGHEAGGGFAAGLMHPLGGADHVLAMVALGLWAAMAGGRALWAAPAVFVAAMLAAALPGALWPAPAGVEPMILASVILLGAAVALARPVPLALALPAVALFGAAHGYAHGAEAPGAGPAGYAAGFALATAALHGAGLLAGLGLTAIAARPVLRGLGGATAAGGAILALAG